jgi:HEAT repeat protein
MSSPQSSNADPEDWPATVEPGRRASAPIVADSDPHPQDEKSAWFAAARTAQDLYTADELLWGLRHHDWHVRVESVSRLIVRARNDERTLPALLEAAIHDRSWDVRDAVVSSLTDFPSGSVLPVLQAAAHDPHQAVRWSAEFALFQMGLGADPGPFNWPDGGDPWCEVMDGERATDDQLHLPT